MRSSGRKICYQKLLYTFSHLRNHSLSYMRSLWLFCPLWIVLQFIFHCEARNITDLVQSEKAHKYNPADVDSLLKALRKVQQLFNLNNFELLKVCANHEEHIPKFLANLFSRSEKNLCRENAVTTSFVNSYIFLSFLSFSLWITLMYFWSLKDP